MTKMKSKKMTKSTFAIIIMAIVMVAMLAFGGTYAYFTANAIGENVDKITTAKLELLNNGIADETGVGTGTRLSYNANKQIVPGDYIFGDGTTDGFVDWTKDTDDEYMSIDLDLGQTNAAVYAFVRVTVKAYAKLESGETVEQAPTLMLNTTEGAVPVLRLIPRLGTDRVDYDAAEPNKNPTAGWQEFTNTQVTDVNSSTYIFYYVVNDEAVPEVVGKDKYRDQFNKDNFDFSLQFDHRVHADRLQLAKNNDGDWVVPAGYTIIDTDKGIAESTNVYEESAAGEYTTPVQIMDVNIYFEMEFATIQQTGFTGPASAYLAAFKTVDERNDHEYDSNVSEEYQEEKEELEKGE